jgi:hypothetical protein
MEAAMVPTFKTAYRNGEIRIGWASWDDGSFTARSIKYAYPDSSRKISRGSPELSFDLLVDMTITALEQNELAGEDVNRLRRALARCSLGGGADANSVEPASNNLYRRIRRRFDPLGGVDIELPPRGPARSPPRFE